MSDEIKSWTDITPATDIDVADCRMYLKNCGGLIVAGDAKTLSNAGVAQLIARIEQEVEGRTQDRAEIERLREAGELAVVLFESIVRAPDEITDRTVANIRYVVSKFSTAGGKDEKE